MGEPVNIGAERAERSQDNRDWTPVQMLESVIKEINSGKSEPTRAIVITMSDENEFYIKSCNIDTFHQISMFQIAKHITLNDFLKGS